MRTVNVDVPLGMSVLAGMRVAHKGLYQGLSDGCDATHANVSVN